MGQEAPKRRDAGVLQVTERDMIVLTWIAEQYCISYDHLQRLLALYTPANTKHPDKVAPSTAHNAVNRWIELGYIETPQKIIREHTTYLWLSRRGIKELNLPYAYYTPKPSTIRHIYAVNAIRLHMQSFNISAEWVAQRTIRLQTEQRPVPDAHTENSSFPAIAVQVVEQQHMTNILLKDEMATLQALTRLYTRIRYFVHAHSIEFLQSAIQEHDANLSPEETLAKHLIWYTLDAREIDEQKKQEPA